MGLAQDHRRWPSGGTPMTVVAQDECVHQRAKAECLDRCRRRLAKKEEIGLSSHCGLTMLLDYSSWLLPSCALRGFPSPSLLLGSGQIFQREKGHQQLQDWWWESRILLSPKSASGHCSGHCLGAHRVRSRSHNIYFQLQLQPLTPHQTLVCSRQRR